MMIFLNHIWRRSCKRKFKSYLKSNCNQIPQIHKEHKLFEDKLNEIIFTSMSSKKEHVIIITLSIDLYFICD